MQITKITISDFRAINYAQLAPPVLKVLVGQNNHGETNFFKAIEILKHKKKTPIGKMYAQPGTKSHT